MCRSGATSVTSGENIPFFPLSGTQIMMFSESFFGKKFETTADLALKILSWYKSVNPEVLFGQ